MILKWVQAAIETCGVETQEVFTTEANMLIEGVSNLYATPGASPLWDRFENDISRRRSDGEQLVEHLCPNSPILLFNDEGVWKGFKFASGADLCCVLHESPGFEFYVTDGDLSYVVCYNHHEYIIGVGDAYDLVLKLTDNW